MGQMSAWWRGEGVECLATPQYLLLLGVTQPAWTLSCLLVISDTLMLSVSSFKDTAN